ncbi:MAG: hypothetical protein M0R46_16490 [Candidatus Muirbacterium halophilum]|nr:hypothetical protein [Candidatus Muirbacterium halophilum]
MKAKILHILLGIITILLISFGVKTCNENNENKIPSQKIEVKEFQGVITHKHIEVKFFREDDCYVKLNNGDVKKLYGKDRITYNVGDTLYKISYKEINPIEKKYYMSKLSFFIWLSATICFIAFGALIDRIYK